MYYNIFMTLKSFIAEHKQDVTNELEELRKLQLTEDLNNLSQQCIQDIFDFTLKGKMLRGIFVLLAHVMFGGTSMQAAIRIAAALELNQTGLLIHDDIMDNDELRRGEPSMFVKYRSVGQKLQVEHTEHFGTSMALLMGDTAFF